MTGQGRQSCRAKANDSGGHRYARELSVIAGAGLVCFEAAGLAWRGLQPLEPVFAVVGVTVVLLAWHTPRTQR